MKRFGSEAEGNSSSMDIEYQNDIKKKKETGKTEGEAVLDIKRDRKPRGFNPSRVSVVR